MATTRVRKLIKKLGENVGMSMLQAMTSPEVGYTQSYAHKADIKKTKGWRELMEKSLPDSKLLKVHVAKG